MFILNTLLIDRRCKTGLAYIEATNQAFQRNSKVNSNAQFPLEFRRDKMAVTIDKRSDNYTLRDNATPPKIINLFARGGQV